MSLRRRPSCFDLVLYYAVTSKDIVSPSLGTASTTGCSGHFSARVDHRKLIMVLYYICSFILWTIETLYVLFKGGRVSSQRIKVANRLANFRYVKGSKREAQSANEQRSALHHRIHSTLSYDSTETTHYPIILVHGIGKSSFDFHPTLRDFLKRSENQAHQPLVIAPDFPGFGKSRGRLSTGHSINEMSEWLSQFMKALNIPKAHIVGASAGCQVVLSFINHYPEMAASMVLISPTMGQNHTFLEYFLNTIKNAMSESHLFNFCHLCMWAQMGWVNFSLSALKFLTDNPLINTNLNVNVPTLIVRGQHDRLVSISDINLLVERLKKPRTTAGVLVRAEIPSGNHNIQFEKSSQLVELLVPFFLRREKESALQNGSH
ncbi:hydrolase [Planoprotostelium fungivorum]|uniref:Hydrolase n=1 Tax=Planoprotostelium fungivorum TaxID=1890364 RepID=A0A2P6MZG4_9EUKA|nr:hydrolase [Planoprotostelium fungivorum]